ncbi:unnamed protein product, partial [Prorocentrum cordatum]
MASAPDWMIIGTANKRKEMGDTSDAQENKKGRLAEQDILGTLLSQANRCSNVLRLLDTAEESGTVYLRLELCSCDLLRFAGAQPGGVLAEPEAALWGAQLMAGLRDIHALGVLHRDVKPENLLLTPGGTLKVADFGWCAYIRDSPCTLAGTFQYMAPEILEQRAVQTEAVDV